MALLTRATPSLKVERVQSTLLEPVQADSPVEVIQLKNEGKYTIDPDQFLGVLRDTRPDNITGAYAFKWDYLISELLTKLPRPGVPAEVRKQRAIDKAMESEINCKKINDFGYNHHVIIKRDLETILFLASKWVSGVLGPVDYAMFASSRHGSGASTSRKRKSGDSYFKFGADGKPVDVTSRAKRYAETVIALTPLWARGEPVLNVVPGNRVFTVPKKTDIDRLCAAEPDMNMYLQLSVGRYIRGALRQVGIDLNKQSINQKLASVGASDDDPLATIDLSSASDSISLRLVWDLLPPQWSDLLDDLRSPIGDIGGHSHEWAKVSSMGNGFTFELESLLFAALVVGTNAFYFSRHTTFGLKGRNAIYGDDIICRSDTGYKLKDVLEAVGFSLNTEKSFFDGPFRESCGKHYYLGHDVTPFYIRKPIKDLSRIIWLGNAVRRWSTDRDICDPMLWHVWRDLMLLVPKYLRGGKGLMGDMALISAGPPKQRLKPQTSSKERRGARGLLTWFQNAQGRDDALIRYALIESPGEFRCVLPSVLIGRYASNDRVFVPPPDGHFDPFEGEHGDVIDPMIASRRAVVKPSWFELLANEEPCVTIALFPQESGCL